MKASSESMHKDPEAGGSVVLKSGQGGEIPENNVKNDTR